MELSRQSSSGYYRLQSYQQGYLIINGQTFAPPLWLTPNTLEPAWRVENTTKPTLADFATIKACDILILGTGKLCQLPEVSLYQGLAMQGMILEAMDSQAACRTFAVLTSENRRAAAAFLA